jgi:hydroxyacid-oxoacid transhydrogenase
VKYELFSDVEVEPTDSSFKRAIKFAQSKPFDAFVAVGGGETATTPVTIVDR